MCAAAHLHPFCLLGSQRTCMICIQRLPKSSQMGFFGVMNWQGYQYLCMVSHRKVTMVTYNTARHADRGQIGNLKQFAKLPPPDPPTMVVVVVVYQTRFQSRAPRQFGIAKFFYIFTHAQSFAPPRRIIMSLHLLFIQNVKYHWHPVEAEQ